MTNPDNMRYVPYALAGLLFGWTVDDVDKMGVYTLNRVLAVGMAIWQETSLLNVLGKALRGMSRGAI